MEGGVVEMDIVDESSGWSITTRDWPLEDNSDVVDAVAPPRYSSSSVPLVSSVSLL